MSESTKKTAEQGQSGARPAPAVAPPASAERTDAKVLTLLVCPVTKSPLDYDAAAQELISRAAGLAFPIREGVPIMLVDQARALEDNE